MGVSATLLALGSVLTSVNAANAAIFNFTFSNVSGPVPGTVSGTITLPNGDFVNQPATNITVTSAPAALGYTLPFDVLANFTNVVQNTFTVVGGAINAATSRFAAFVAPPPGGLGSAFSLNSNNPSFNGSNFNIQLTATPFTGVVDDTNATLNYPSGAPATTPEPTSVITLIGVGVLGVASKLKKKA